MSNEDQDWADLLSPARRGLLRGGGLMAAFAASGIVAAQTHPAAGKSPWGYQTYKEAATQPRSVRPGEQSSPLKPRGPHVTSSFYFGFSNEQLQVIVPWLQLNSLGLTILIHPNTDHPRADHLHYTLWVKRSQPVNACARASGWKLRAGPLVTML